MSGVNRKVYISVTEYDLGDNHLTFEAVLFWQGRNIDTLLSYQLVILSLSMLYHNVISTMFFPELLKPIKSSLYLDVL